MVDFDERSGVIWSLTEWGSWGQTIEEVFIKINLPENTSSKQVVLKTTAKSIKCTVKGKVIFEVYPLIVISLLKLICEIVSSLYYSENAPKYISNASLLKG